MPTKKSAPAPSLIQAPAPTAPAKRSPGRNLQLQIGMITVPIKLHTGARAERISFRQLHSQCLGKLKQSAMHCPTCDVSVDSEEIVKGYEYAKDQYVIIQPEELEAQRPESSTTVEITTFVEAGSVDPIYLETSHYLTPGDGGARPYMLVREILRKTGKVGIGRATFGSSEQIVLIRPYQNGIALHTLFYQQEVKSAPFALDQLSLRPEEMKLAGQLVDSMSDKFDPSAFSDSYAANVKELVAAKVAGTAPKIVVRKSRPVHEDLMAALSASLSVAKGRKKAA